MNELGTCMDGVDLEQTMRVLIATTNPGKVVTAKKILASLGYVGASFSDQGLELMEPEETMEMAQDIAAEKALGYARQFRDFPVLARDDTSFLVGVRDEDDPKNHNKEFVARRVGSYSDENGTKVFAEVARKYGGEVPLVFHWGYALAWWEGDEIKVVSGLAVADNMKIVEEPSKRQVPGFSFAPVTQVFVDGRWLYDTELTESQNWRAYWDTQATTVGGLLERCPLL